MFVLLLWLEILYVVKELVRVKGAYIKGKCGVSVRGYCLFMLRACVFGLLYVFA